MFGHSTMAAAVGLALLVPAAAGAQSAGADRSPIYGSEIMTRQERLDYRQRMHEKAQIRAEHHQRMQQRALQVGKNLPDEPPYRGNGAGKGMDSGKAMGPGPARGMGRGAGR